MPDDGPPNESAREVIEALPVPLGRDRFLRTLLRELTGTLEEVVGLDEAEGYISVVGNAVGRQIDGAYRTALRTERMDRREVAAALVDLKRRIEGDFYIIEETDERIVLGNRRCPFGAFVEGRPSLCMMTANVFGRIAADNLGYARVDLQETIAQGDGGCRVIVHLRPDGEAGTAGREYFREVDAAGE